MAAEADYPEQSVGCSYMMEIWLMDTYLNGQAADEGF